MLMRASRHPSRLLPYLRSILNQTRIEVIQLVIARIHRIGGKRWGQDVSLLVDCSASAESGILVALEDGSLILRAEAWAVQISFRIISEFSNCWPCGWLIVFVRSAVAGSGAGATISVVPVCSLFINDRYVLGQACEVELMIQVSALRILDRLLIVSHKRSQFSCFYRSSIFWRQTSTIRYFWKQLARLLVWIHVVRSQLGSTSMVDAMLAALFLAIRISCHYWSISIWLPNTC